MKKILLIFTLFTLMLTVSGQQNTNFNYSKKNLYVVDTSLFVATWNYLLQNYEPKIPASDTTKFWRGDKTWQTVVSGSTYDTTYLYTRIDSIAPLYDSLATKQSTLTNPVTGTGTSGYISRFTGTSVLDSSNLYYSLGRLGIGLTNPSQLLDVNGKIALKGTKALCYPTGMIGSIVIGDGGISISHTTGSEGYYNTLIGVGAGSSNTTGYGNVFCGTNSGYYNTTGYNNTYNGVFSGKNYGVSSGANETSSYGIYLGYDTRSSADGVTNEIVIGKSAVASGSNSVTLGGTDITKTVLRGNVGIGTTAPTSLLHVKSLASSTPLFTASNNKGAGVDSTVTILPNGNVGIGTTDPTKGKLQIVGNDFSAFGSLGLDIKTINNDYCTFQLTNSIRRWQFSHRPTTGSFEFYYTGVSNSESIWKAMFAIDTNKNVTIYGNINAATTYSATVGGTNRDLYIDNTGLLGYVSSSKRYKANIKGMENVDWLYKLRPVNFTLKSDSTNAKQYGLIAEEVDQVNRAFVSYDKEGKPETVSYSSLVTPLLKAIQDQKKLIDELTKRIEQLEK